MFLTIKLCTYIWTACLCYTELFQMELLLTSKLYLLFTIELFWHLTMCKENLYLYYTELAELELFDETE